MSRKQVKEERRQQILEALHQCLTRKPFDKTSIKDIAAVAGVNHGVLHYYFKSKEDILLNYIEYIISRHSLFFGEWLLKEGQVLEGPEDFIRRSIAYMTRKITLDRDLSRVFIEIWEISIYNEKVRKKLQQAYLAWSEVVTGMLKKKVRSKESAMRLGIGLIAFLEGISLFSVVFEKTNLDVEAVLTDFQNRLLNKL